MLKQYFKDYLDFTARERKGIILLLSILVLLQILPGIQRKYFLQRKPVKISVFPGSTLKTDSGNLNKPMPDVTTAGTELFYFDPNTVSKDDWLRLGVNEKAAQTIINYRAKGGRFKKADDLRKIYSLSASEADRLIPFVRFPNADVQKQEQTFTERQQKTFQVIEINSADSNQWKSLPGIGSRLATRIIAFRNKLGGFYSVNQVAETYFLPDSTFQKIRVYLRVDPSRVQKIDLNEADFAGLVKHPYIDKGIANTILQYRREHGDFESTTDLRRLVLIHDSVYHKIKNYVKVKADGHR